MFLGFFSQQIQLNDQKQEFNKRPAKAVPRSLPRSISQSSTDSFPSGTKTSSHVFHLALRISLSAFKLRINVLRDIQTDIQKL